LPPTLREPAAPAPVPAIGVSSLAMTDAEKELIIRALKQSDGSRTLAAKKLGISRRTLYRKLAEYKLEGY
jgi:transcriptional regulator of acetoin/glycerol metabolism